MGLFDFDFPSDLFEKKQQYGESCVTLRGEKVKSYGEKQIADYLYQNGIDYEYEAVAKTSGRVFDWEISKPDFYLPQYSVYIEYWGLVDADDDENTSSKYVGLMKWKMAQYYKNHIKFISLYPSNLDNLDWILRAKFRDVTGVELPKRRA